MFEDGDFSDSRCVSGMRDIFARNPLLVRHAVEQSARYTRGAAQGFLSRLIAACQVIEHANFCVLLLRSFLRTR